MEKISPPVRILAILIVLVGVAGMLAMRTMAPSVDESAPIPLPVKKTQTAAPAKATPKAVKTTATVPAAKTKAKPVAATPKPVAAKPKPLAAKPKPVLNPAVPPTGFPVAVDKALRRNAVVVVSLVVPGARVAELAAAEAKAGAKLSGAGFVALNVLNEGVARTLLNKLVTDQDPSLLVINRSGEVVVELAGFVDRETVAQAAANATS